ncbi:Lrp/AsnC family transcriptional regulator [Nonomuraea sp. NPDC050404]|uniref:Lrp/AsnC family transcriptional regulator n=1 Tax=Nonomuraea sp. NPDC050404 TaxID=3155783 RepID=UPI0033EA9818
MPDSLDATPPGLDAADLDLVAALQRAPRAGVRLLAEVLDVAPSTVSRRLTRLVEARLLKVISQLNWSVLTEIHPQHLWIAARPGAAGRVAKDVAALPETQYAALTAGRSDVYCILQPSARAQNADLLTERIGGIDGVLSSHTEIVLRSYASATTWLLDRLTPGQEARLRAENPAAPRPADTSEPNADERRVVRALQEDGRASAADIARRLGLSQSTAYRLAQSVLDRRLVIPRVEIEPALLGFPLEAVISLTAEPRAIRDLAATLGRHPSARFVSTVAGISSMIYHGAFRDENDLDQLLTGDLAALDGIRTVEVAIVLRVLTRYWLPREGLRLGA